MTACRSVRVVAMLLVLGATPLAAGGQVPPTPKPGPEHEVLKMDLGTWDAVVEMAQAPGAPATMQKPGRPRRSGIAIHANRRVLQATTCSRFPCGSCGRTDPAEPSVLRTRARWQGKPGSWPGARRLMCTILNPWIALKEKADCDRTVIRGLQNLEEHRGLRTHTA
jgi:hypothetical protein